MSIIKAPERRTIDELESRESALGAVAAHHPRIRWSATTDLVHQTTSNERVPVATVREQLQAEAESRAQHQDIPIEQTPEH